MNLQVVIQKLFNEYTFYIKTMSRQYNIVLVVKYYSL